ncbi:unnamed protein product [Polarella glacialis]|uniref:Uncharacterized protein n=1 Tax=Polarella glacialis TaxID=89957 RepID=A0A813DLG6_POLGL|nr:unnamed protein product [Polarella glacialis]
MEEEPLGSPLYNCAQVIPMSFGFLLLVFNGRQEGIEAYQTDENPAGDTAHSASTLTMWILCNWALADHELPALVLETNEIMVIRFPLGYYNCAPVTPISFGFLLLVFNGVQGDIEANMASDTCDAHGSSASLNAMPAKVYVAHTVGLIFFDCSFYFGSRL